MTRLFHATLLMFPLLFTACSVSPWEAEEYYVEAGPPREFQGETFDEYP